MLARMVSAFQSAGITLDDSSHPAIVVFLKRIYYIQLVLWTLTNAEKCINFGMDSLTIAQLLEYIL